MPVPIRGIPIGVDINITFCHRSSSWYKMDGDTVTQAWAFIPQYFLQTAIPLIRSMALKELAQLFQDLVPSQRQPSDYFLGSLDNTERHTVFLACTLVFLLSHGKVVPWEFQLEAVLGALSSHDGIIASGTGSGKTLIMIMLLLLRPAELCVLIVPLK